ncbi:hypothetical protein [Roseovarius atlanticus]|uniref:hypothetical protein n=1 Tax=Roseovarius atlanticus TaxID=1641875 RepID=UPI001C986B26|nr:hypothetical protein [Roseovarius atlanticus]MBY5988087.1 hypothetical protein [Roseovarius atlanticus]MBY6123478.1 hypothetical protein [Roseovarius atlanticus]MBY6147973.1 hypothetical protein [Roseovarius atlanticus]
MFKSTVLGALALGFCFTTTATTAQADLTADVAASLHLARDGGAAPALNHEGQWWTHPKGCEYSRAGRGGEVVWYLIINTARPGCPVYIVSYSPYNDVY